ncbi:DNA mismatch repair protein MutS [Jannaschia pagri]|uniref:DNA mismatch repair protein MutS n=1 Tax=Jannaschia pagri TaxID=2829797 RepID=A0ABQ4NM50_9RHOB|nr:MULTISPECIES: DNA mismatch repair protein MutS [unclassified Jannaschia]GIT91460.1 DNA mismatch repair protein MutS [Jannaschia sp. AI_61]GIT95294.1 DNA mismatch repair protein MutS [Jannaschia sp. AI_62]
MSVTPMMAQFLEIKAEAPDALLFYRMGDFYELFFDDAVAASAALDIALTKRGKHLGEDIAMCGVPVHSAENYLMTLIRKGFRVAVAEQLEAPEEAKKRGSKSVVKRGIVRLVTPGTLTEDTLLDARAHNYLAAFAEVRGQGALAWADISTGAFHVATCPRVRLGPDLARLGVREVIVVDGTDIGPVIEDLGAAVTPLGASAFDSTAADGRLRALFDVGSLEAFGAFGRAELGAMGALVEYVELTQRGKLPLMRPPQRQSADDLMAIDAATRRNLELTRGATGGRDGSLLWAIDRTVTAAGGRLLERRVSAPSAVEGIIRARHDAVDWALSEDRLAEDIRSDLRRAPDMDRALSRLSLERGGPRDLAAIRNGLEAADSLYQRVFETSCPLDVSNLIGQEGLRDVLARALVAEPPMMLRDGGVVAPGYDAELDEVRTLRDEGRGVIAGLQGQYIEETGIASLKVKHNNVLGYFVETTATHADKMRADDRFIHRQTTANQVRFTTIELSELETKILNAGGRAQQIEDRIFEDLRAAVLDASDAIFAAARCLAELDVMTGLADLAKGETWCRPRVDSSRAFAIEGGRHPVVERALKRDGAPFVANDTALSADGGAAIRLLTGPNMAGKSTWLRQNALIAVLAQMGSFVPADSAHIGVVSQLFSRVGASDDLARGRSTFMVEMVETAAILNQADDRALVILDEIGRGTATYDGLSIAWATLEHLHDVNRCRALFATHYHEMTALASKLDGVENATVAVREWEGDVIFLHEVREGAADRSYGVQVAKLAGLPEAVVSRAREVLNALEEGEREGGSKPKALIDDLPLFSAVPTPLAAPVRDSGVEARMKTVLPDALSPREALDLIYELKALTDGAAG